MDAQHNQFAEQIVKRFQDYVLLCQLDNWPNVDTAIEQIRIAFTHSEYIEKCIEKLKNANLLSELITALSNKVQAPPLPLKECLINPPKYVLKKIIVSSVSVEVMEESFNIFVQLFSEDKLEVCLSEIILEMASKDTLLRCMSSELPTNMLVDLKSIFFLSENDCVEDPSTVILEKLDNCTLDVMNMLVVCLLNDNDKYERTVKAIADGFVSKMSSQNVSNKSFWKFLLDTEEDKFIQMCLKHKNIFMLILQALIGCAEIHEKNMSFENFHIELTYTELWWNIKKICREQNLKLILLGFLNENDMKSDFLAKIIEKDN